MSEAQAFCSEGNGSLPLRKVASSGAMSRVVKPFRTECRVAKTTLKHYVSVPSLLPAHASLSVGRNVNCGIRVEN
jgi:hypothetical protein